MGSMSEKPKTQADKFRDMARALECDEDEEAFKAKLRKVARAPQAPRSPRDHKRG
jgi:hypothetical protein